MDEEIVINYVRYLKAARKSDNTIKEYKSIINKMIQYFKKPVNEIGEKDIENYMEYLTIDKKLSKSTTYLTLMAIKSFLEYTGNKEVKIKLPRRSRKMPTYLNEQETHALIDKAHSSPRNYALLCILAYTGMRVSEACKLMLEDIDLDDMVIRIHSGKGDKDRIVVLEEKTVVAINKWLEYRRKKKIVSNYLFYSPKNRDKHLSPISVERIVKEYSREIGILKHVTPHVLRHTLATTLLKNGADIRFIQKLLGHSSISTTELYTQVDNTMLKEVYKRSKPKY
ncbi:MAG: site-specific tyrosine recombinase/integron integrase [Thermoplasmata archaeon]